MNPDQPHHILFSCPDDFPDVVVEKLTADIYQNGLKLKVDRRPIEPQASFEWAVPGLLFAYVAKPYFESFLSEAGKDHYQILSKWLKKVAIDSRLIKVKTITAGQSTEKVNNSNTQSKAISIYIETADNKRVKLLFDETLDDNVWANSIDSFLSLALANHASYPNDSLSSILNKYGSTGNSTYYAVINRDTMEWEILNDQMLFDRYLQQKNQD